ncbi:MAG: hypothetical protein ABIT81_04725 [Ferruginibacter sp.]
MKKLLPALSKAFTLLVLSIIFIYQTGFSQTATFTTSGTWTCPAGVTSISVECWGGGGAGGGSTTNTTAGGGGGGGAYNKNLTVAVVPNTVYTITVGAGGIGGTGAGVIGAVSTTTFGVTTVSANGGSGGAAGAGVGGAGGAGGAGGLYNGGAGGTGISATFLGGGGGSSAGTANNGNFGTAPTGGLAVAGGGSGGNGANGGSANVDGLPGASPGGGGGGAYKKNGASGNNGGSGGNGQIKITWGCTSYNSLSAATTATNACTGNSSTVTVTSATLPSGTYTVTYNLSAPNAVTGATAIMNFTAGSPGTGTFSSGVLGSSGATTLTITSLASGGTTGTVSGATNCSSTITTNNTANITVNLTPAQPSPIGGTTPACVATSQTYSVTNVGGTTYAWTVPSGWTINSGQGTNSISCTTGLSGNVSVTATVGSCTSISRTLAVTVNGSVPGTYTVGPTGAYASLTAAMAAVSNGCTSAGAFIFELQSTYNSSVEAFPIALPVLSWASASNTVTIRPETGASNLSISGSSTTGIVNLTAGKYYIIDGRAGGTGSTQNLSVINTSTSGYVMQFSNDAQNNVVKYCGIQGVNSSATSGNIVFSTSATTGGNSSNTIDNCDIRDGASTPSNAIYSNGTITAGRQNINNIISNSNIYNFFSSTNGGNGIYLGAGTTDWTISGNSFYQTSSRALSSGDTWSAIQLNNTASGNNINITGNYFGGTTPNAASGTMTFTGGGILNLIKMAGSTGTASSIQGNTIKNISFTTSSGATPHSLIRYLQGNANIGTATGNTIGSQSSTGSIVFIGSVTSEFAGISAGSGSVGSTDVFNVSNNTIGGIDISGSGSVSFAAIKLRGVPGSCTINNNIVGSSTTANSISISNQAESFGIQCFVGSSTGLQTISNNTVANIWLSNAASSGNHLWGISAKDATAGTAGGIYTISNNTVFKLISASKIVVGDFTTAGISLNVKAQGGQTISGNHIYSLYDTDPVVASGMVGIDYAGPTMGTNKVEKNFIHDLSVNSNKTTGLGAMATIVALNINNGVTTYSNNIISLGDSSGISVTRSYEIYGVGDFIGEVSSGGNGNGYNHYLHNTVYIGGSGVSGGTNKTFAYYNSVPDTRTRTIKNNIFYNARSGTGNHYAMYYPPNVTGVTNVTSDYNDLYVSGTGGKIGYLNAVSYDTITTWRTATSKDAMSVTDDPLLVNPEGSVLAKDLHIQTGSICNNEATPNTPVAITTDFDGTARDVVHGSYPATPDIGAYELVRGTSPGTWIGIISTDWFNTANWDDGVVPTNIIHTYIARGHNDAAATQYFPVITTGGSAQCKNIVLHLPTTNLTVTGTGVMKVAGIIKSGNNINKGVFNLVDGTLELNGTSGTQNIAGNMFFQTTIKNLTASNNVNIINQWAPDTVRITGLASFGNVNSKTITTNSNLTLVSSATATSALADITNGGTNSGNAVSGNVTVERYISAGRKWRFLSFPTSGQTFKQSWQEGATSSAQNLKPGYGMYITDNNSGTWSANGFDAYSIGGPSIKTYNAGSNSWVGIANTNTVVSGTQGLMTFVRGNRANAVASATITPSVLRSTGTLYQNTQSDITVPINTFVTIGNPYAAAVDLRLLDKLNTTDFFYVWDPKLSGLYSVGAYQLFSRSGANYVVTPGGGSYGTPGAISNYLESGQAFFIRGAGSTGRVTFKENAKAYGNAWFPYFTQGQSQDLRATLLIPGIDTLVADGVFVNYDNSYSSSVDDDDALKFGNANENVSLLRGNKLLSVERRKEISDADTLFINITGLRVQSYQWKFQLDNMDAPGRFGFLIDNYLNSSTPLNLDGITDYNFSVENVPASYAPDRFKVLWTEYSALPVSFTSIAANRNNNGSIGVQWKTENEVNIQEYQLERSTDSRSFNSISVLAPKANNGSNAVYTYADNNPLSADNFYRVKAISSNGQVQFSSIVKVAILKSPASISIYPNLVTDKKMNIQFMQQPVGNYSLQLSNLQGQVIFQSTVLVNATVFAKTIELPASIAAGQYQLLISNISGEKTVQKIIIE